jgi:hypothetical protein
LIIFKWEKRFPRQSVFNLHNLSYFRHLKNILVPLGRRWRISLNFKWWKLGTLRVVNIIKYVIFEAPFLIPFPFVYLSKCQAKPFWKLTHLIVRPICICLVLYLEDLNLIAIFPKRKFLRTFSLDTFNIFQLFLLGFVTYFALLQNILAFVEL